MDPTPIELIINRIDRIEGKVDQLLEFKWKVYGVTACVAAFTTVTVQLVLK